MKVSIKKKNDELDFIKIKNMSSSNEKIKRMRGYSPQTGRKYLQYTYLTEDLRQLIRNKEKIRHVKKEDILAVHKHEEVLHRENAN